MINEIANRNVDHRRRKQKCSDEERWKKVSGSHRTRNWQNISPLFSCCLDLFHLKIVLGCCQFNTVKVTCRTWIMDGNNRPVSYYQLPLITMITDSFLQC